MFVILLGTGTNFSAISTGFCDRFCQFENVQKVTAKVGEDIPGTYGSSQSIVYEKFELIYMRESGEQMKNSGIGGQAVIEGVMMKNKDQYAVAVRTPDDKIVVDMQEYKSISEKYRLLKLPLLRGVVAFCESMSIGMKTLTYSASFYEEEEEQARKSAATESILSIVMVLLAAVIAVGLFIALPWFIAEKLSTVIEQGWLQALVEGGIRLVIFIAYVVAISFTKDSVHVEICSKCHSFYTGQQKAIQARGAIDKFNRRYGLTK